MTNMPFIKFLTEIRKGEISEALDDRFSELLQAVQEHGSKGSLSFTVTIEPDKKGDHQNVSFNVKSKLPERPLRSAIGWITEDGEFTRQHPAQTDIEDVIAGNQLRSVN